MTVTAVPLISSVDAARSAGISYRQLDYWSRQGFIAPLVPATGSGSRRAWGVDQVPVLRFLRAAIPLVISNPVSDRGTPDAGPMIRHIVEQITVVDPTLLVADLLFVEHLTGRVSREPVYGHAIPRETWAVR